MSFYKVKYSRDAIKFIKKNKVIGLRFFMRWVWPCAYLFSMRAKVTKDTLMAIFPLSAHGVIISHLFTELLRLRAICIILTE